MTKRTLPAIFFLTIITSACTGQYNGPESVEYDPVGDRYFISNTGNNSIVQRDQMGNVTPFASALPAAPYGLEIQGDTLFACMGSGVRGYALTDGSEVFNLSLGASFPNGITSDGQYLYVTDFGAGSILRVDPDAQTFTTWVANTAGTPNGIVYDAPNNRMLVAFWGSNAAVKAYNRNTAALVGSLNTGLTNIDGIAVDCLGLIYVCSWSPDQATIIDELLISVTGPWVTNLNNPADIDFDEVNGLLCIPNSGNNTVTFSVLPECTTGITEEAQSEVSIHPIPSAGTITISGTVQSQGRYRLSDIRGKVVCEGMWYRNEVLELNDLDSGSYFMDLQNGHSPLRLIIQ